MTLTVLPRPQIVVHPEHPDDEFARATSLHLDLSKVADFDSETVRLINWTWTLLTSSGWSVSITAPDAIAVRADFMRAAIRGDLAWACASVPRDAAVRKTSDRPLVLLSLTQ